MEHQHPGGWGWNIHELKSEINRKADKYEMDSITSRVASLERTAREIRATLDGLQSQLQTLQEITQRLTNP